MALMIPVEVSDLTTTTNRAVISTIHSAKGLDYSVVFLLSLDYLAPKAEGWTAEQIDHLIYVRIIRSSYRLIIQYVKESGSYQEI